jgi:hypothetical protein
MTIPNNYHKSLCHQWMDQDSPYEAANGDYYSNEELKREKRQSLFKFQSFRKAWIAGYESRTKSLKGFFLVPQSRIDFYPDYSTIKTCPLPTISHS